MGYVRCVVVCLVVLMVGSTAVMAGGAAPLAWEHVMAATLADTPEAQPAGEPPPLPFHSIEGCSGAPITPMAYLCNAGPAGCKVGKPSVGYTYINLGSKHLHAVSVTQTFFGRLELGYAFNCFNLGSLGDDVHKAGLSIGTGSVNLHHFNARLLLLPENSFDLPLPAVTAGVHFKYNDGIEKINRHLGGALKSIGYDKNYGTDFTLTATKMFPTLAFGRPVIASVGLRNSRAAQIGLLGFGDECSTTVEGNLACLVTDNLALAYEFRQKENPYHQIPKLIGREQNWHAFSLSWVANENITLTGFWGVLGNVANARADDAFGVQIKFEF